MTSQTAVGQFLPTKDDTPPRGRASEPETVNPHRRIQAAEVRALCGGVSDMWIWRRLSDPASGFPRPQYIGRTRFWREAEVVAWLDAQASEGAA